MRYFGNGPYCYSNAVSMLLSSAGEEVSPSLVEVLTGVGHGPVFYEERSQLFYFGDCHMPPDSGITAAMTELGFDFTETACDTPDSPPLDRLASALKNGPAILGPLDMSLLKYNPSHKYLKGADHFVLAYGMDERHVYLHDPEGFPFVQLPIEDLVAAWRADSVDYKRGHYRCWHSPSRTRHPSTEDLTNVAMEQIKVAYSRMESVESVKTGDDATLLLLAALMSDPVSGSLKSHLLNFALKLAARRAGDYAEFFRESRPVLSDLKYQQAVLLGRCQSNGANDDWSTVADDLRTLSELEERIRRSVMEQS